MSLEAFAEKCSPTSRISTNVLNKCTEGGSSPTHLVITAFRPNISKKGTVSLCDPIDSGMSPNRHKIGLGCNCLPIITLTSTHTVCQNHWTFSHSQRQWNRIPIQVLYLGQFGEAPVVCLLYGDTYTFCNVLYCISLNLLHMEIFEGKSKISSHFPMSTVVFSWVSHDFPKNESL